MIYFSNSLSGRKEQFVHTSDQPVKLYVCGITPYSYAHIGHGRCYISFDLVYRLLHAMGYAVTYCRNVTDIDDKLLEKAHKELGDKMRYQELATFYFEAFQKSLAALNCKKPTYEPRVTENISVILECIERLIDKGYAYVTDGDVYFKISSALQYGALSGQKISDLRAGTRFGVASNKQDSLDFALWKAEPEGTFWSSPWGNGRPGWHIECSALAYTFLGEHIDIHGGGLDLLFPHHENELCQSEGMFGAPFTRFWMHNGMITVNNEKMSKSLGNYIVLDDLLKAHDAMVVRYYYLTYHYKQPAEFSESGLAAAQKTYERLVNFFADTQARAGDQATMPVLAAFHAMVCDDLNTPGALGVLFEHLAVLQADNAQRSAIKYYLHDVFGLTLQSLTCQKVLVTPEMEALINERTQARQEKNWQKADALRDQLRALGFEVHDTK